MKTRERFWIIHHISIVKFCIANCGKCALLKVKLIHQLMADLPSFRVTVCNEPLKFIGHDYLSPYIFRQNRGDSQSVELAVYASVYTLLYVKLVTSLDLNSFFLAYTRLFVCAGQWTLFIRRTF